MSETTKVSAGSSCEDSCESSTKNKYNLGPVLLQKLSDLPEVIKFIEMLQNYIEKQKKKLRKLKLKLKKRKHLVDSSTQTSPVPSCDSENISRVEAKSLAEDIKEAAEMATKNSGFVYEETSGMYYDYNTGYYYNAEYGLYYDGTSGTYLKYNQDTQSYEFHSQVTSSQDQEEFPREKKKGKRKKKNNKHEKETKRPRKLHPNAIDVEEGECSDSLSDDDLDGANSDTSDISRQYPPCMRVIIESSQVPKVKVGSLSIITCNGGSVGREGNHSILIPDINTSKHHLKLSFDKESGCYRATDLGSRNGTLLNGKRMSPSKQESEPLDVNHGSRIQIGSTVLLCHIHDGNQTCGHCEPGLIQTHEAPLKINNTSKTERHKSELKSLRKKFGVGGYEEDPKLASGYTDRAQKRRETVGSQNPHEKTQVASLDESISSENKGFKMLAKMGWKSGESLGKDGEGLKEPIKPVSNEGTAGIGSTSNSSLKARVDVKRNNIWMKTQERFQKLPSKSEIFELLDESD